MNEKTFKVKVFKSLMDGRITKDEAKECLRRGFKGEELPLFYDFEEKQRPLKLYIDGLEKMGIIEPLFR